MSRAKMKRKVETFIEEGKNGGIYRKIDASESTFSKIAKITKWRSEVGLEIVSVNTFDGPASATGHKKQMISVTGTADDPIPEEYEVVLSLHSLGRVTRYFRGSVIDYLPAPDGSKSFTATIDVKEDITSKVS